MECEADACSLCLTLKGLCELLQHRIFSGPVFPEAVTSLTSRTSSPL
jgi:hypothetical protein